MSKKKEKYEWAINMKALKRVKRSVHLRLIDPTESDIDTFGHEAYQIICTENRARIASPIFVITNLATAQDIVRKLRLKVFRSLYPKKVVKPQEIQKETEIYV